MYFMEGFLKGLPKILSDTSYEFLKQQDGYFVRAKIIKLNRHLDFPLSSKLNEESGVRELMNEMGNGTISIDKIGLEELIEYHKAEFGIIGGCYYNEGRSNTINHVIKDLYDLGKKLKQDKNPAQMVIKLLMNSMCVKTIIKPVGTYTIVKGNRGDFGKSISYHCNYIDSVKEVNNNFILKRLSQSYLI